MKQTIKTVIKSAVYVGPNITLNNIKFKDLTMPIRIQRTQWLGWKCPKDAIYCGRPTKYGNPFKVETHGRSNALRLFREMLRDKFQRGTIGYPSDHVIRHELAGKNLVCWCALDEDCHVDDLLRIANST